ncbi:hypothetical protein C8R45DRAFT_1215992 [Mycena sanguinolenta]|nr:hypothetical protein C8R45DRAFT_1215992 [Mycena sanguinolenta]
MSAGYDLGRLPQPWDDCVLGLHLLVKCLPQFAFARRSYTPCTLRGTACEIRLLSSSSSGFLEVGFLIPITRLTTSINPALFANELEYPCTGQGFDETFEFLFKRTQATAGAGTDLVFMWWSRLYSDVTSNSLVQTADSDKDKVSSSSPSARRTSTPPSCPDLPLSSSSSSAAADPVTLTLPSPPFTPARLPLHQHPHLESSRTATQSAALSGKTCFKPASGALQSAVATNCHESLTAAQSAALSGKTCFKPASGALQSAVATNCHESLTAAQSAALSGKTCFKPASGALQSAGATNCHESLTAAQSAALSSKTCFKPASGALQSTVFANCHESLTAAQSAALSGKTCFKPACQFL